MPGYTKAELKHRKLTPAQYRWCRGCRLYWHQRARHVHGVAAKRVKPRGGRRKAKPLTEAEKHFIDFLVDEAIQHWLAQAKS
jgi:hypothetical protein